MPNIKSQAKRVEVSAIENARNSAKKTKVKNAIKKFNAAVEAKDLATAEVAYRAAIGEILPVFRDLSRIKTTGKAGGLLCGYKPLLLAGAESPPKLPTIANLPHSRKCGVIR